MTRFLFQIKYFVFNYMTKKKRLIEEQMDQQLNAIANDIRIFTVGFRKDEAGHCDILYMSKLRQQKVCGG